MPITSRYNADRDWFEQEFSARIEPAMMREQLDYISAHPNWGDGKPRLVRCGYDTDFSAMTLDSLGEEMAPFLRTSAHRFDARAPTAIIARDDVQHAVVSFCSLVPVMKDLLNVHVFTHEAKAIEFLEAARV